MAQAGANEHWGGIAIKVGSTLPMHLPSAPYLLPLSPFFHEFDHAFHLAIKVQKTLFSKPAAMYHPDGSTGQGCSLTAQSTVLSTSPYAEA